jgi:transglutaminase-like putative cysteine protease
LPLNAIQARVQDLPQDTLVYLMGSRYCETDKLSQFAWAQFGGYWEGWSRVKAIFDFVHNHIRFSYANAGSDRTAFDAFNEGTGVCRDFAHLAITLCRHTLELCNHYAIT